MDGVDQLIELERQLWTGGAELYRAALARSCLMVFPGLGVLDREAIIEGIAGGQRWAGVEIHEPRVTPLVDGAAILSYGARAWRRGEEEGYGALVSSAYVREDGAWKLAFHHQSPTG